MPTACCANTIPCTLYVTLSGCASGGGTITWNPGLEQWDGTITAGSLVFDAAIRCNGESWAGITLLWAARCHGVPGNVTSAIVSVRCDPFAMVMSGVISNPGGADCCDGGHVTIIITE